MALTLTLWTSDPQLAAWADGAGVDRIGLDLESLHKGHRQKGLPTWLSPHTMEDLAVIRPAIRRAQLFVRTNPLNPQSQAEVDALIAQGVAVLMLPNFTTLDDVSSFLTIVAGRAEVVPLVERLAAIELIPHFSSLGLKEIHIGLNDLSIDLGYDNRLEVLVSPEIERIAQLTNRTGLRLGIGGLGKAVDERLPIPSDLVYAQHARMGSQGALIARSFFSEGMNEAEFAHQIRIMRERFEYWGTVSVAELEAADQALRSCFSREMEAAR